MSELGKMPHCCDVARKKKKKKNIHSVQEKMEVQEYLFILLIINTLVVKQTDKPCSLSEGDYLTDEGVSGQTQV